MVQRRSRYRRFAVVFAAALFPGVSFVVGSVISHVAGAVQAAFIAVGAACSSLAAYLTLRSKAALADAEILALSENLCAVVENVARFAHETAPAGELRVQTVDSITALMATTVGRSARCAFYALEAEGRRLHRRGQYGDVSQAPEVYTADDQDGRDLLWALGRRTTMKIVDTRATWGYPAINLGDDYRSSILAPVRAGARPVGVLIVDAPPAGAFSDVDESIVRLFSLLLGIVQGTADRAAVPAPLGRPRSPSDGGGSAAPQERQGDERA